MRTEAARPVRLTDYRPPDWLVDTVDLDVRLHPTETLVTAKLALRPNPAGRPDAPIVLDGDGLTLTSIALDDWPLRPNAFEVTASTLTIPVPPPRPLALTLTTRIDPSANTQLMGLYRSRGTYCTQCEAEGLPPHHLFSRPAGRAGGLHHPHRGRTRRGAGAARQRQSGGGRRRRRHGRHYRGLARSRSPSPATCSRWSAATSRR